MISGPKSKITTINVRFGQSCEMCPKCKIWIKDAKFVKATELGRNWSCHSNLVKA